MLILLADIAKADICFQSFENDTINSKVIFVGEVVDITYNYWYRSEPKRIYTFKLSESFKGLRQGTGYVSVIGPVNGCCIDRFAIDSTYIVFAYSDYEDSDFLWTNDCSNSGLLSESGEIYSLLNNSIRHNPTSFDFSTGKDAEIELLSHEITRLQSEVEQARHNNDGSKRCFYILACLSIFLFIMVIILLLRKRKTAPL